MLGWSKSLAGGISAKEGVGCCTGQKQPPPCFCIWLVCRKCLSGLRLFWWNFFEGLMSSAKRDKSPSQINTALCRGHWAGRSSPELTLRLSVLAKHGKDMAKPSWPFPNIDPLVLFWNLGGQKEFYQLWDSKRPGPEQITTWTLWGGKFLASQSPGCGVTRVRLTGVKVPSSRVCSGQI